MRLKQGKPETGSNFDGSQENPRIYKIERSRGRRKLGRREFLAMNVGIAGAALTALKTEASEDFASASQTSSDVLPALSCNITRSHGGRVNEVVFNNDGKMLASASQDDTIKIWSNPDGRLLKQFEGDFSPNGFESLCSDSKGKWFAAASWRTVFLYSWSNLSKVRETELDNLIDGLAFSPDGNSLVVLKSDDEVMFLTVPGLQKKGTVNLPAWQYYSLAVSPDGKWLATGEEGKVNIFAIKRFKRAKPKFNLNFGKSSSNVTAMVFTPDNKYLITALQGGELIFWKTSPWKYVKSLKTGLNSISCIAINSKGKLFAIGGKQGIKTYTFPKGKSKKQMIRETEVDNSAPASLAFNPSNTLLAAGYGYDNGGYLTLWQHTTGKTLRCFVDVESTWPKDKVKTYEYDAAGGGKVRITVPNCTCAVKVPANAHCVCDSVSGNYCECDSYCSCHYVHTYWYPN